MEWLNLKNLTKDKRSSLFRSNSVSDEKEKFNGIDTRRKIRRRVLIVEKTLTSVSFENKN
jgi:hypothetical protein